MSFRSPHFPSPPRKPISRPHSNCIYVTFSRLRSPIYPYDDRPKWSRSSPKPSTTVMDKLASSAAGCAFLQTSPMVYALISDPRIVDNPDIPSYQLHVHGRCDPPALIPLPMNRVELEVDCFMDTAFIRVTGSWKVHCVKSSRSCGCRISIPMGKQGSILGVEVVEVLGVDASTGVVKKCGALEEMTINCFVSELVNF